MANRHINPETLFSPEGYSQVVVSRGGQTIRVAGLASLTESMELVGDGDYKAQTIQTFKNIELALAAAGASLTDLVATTIYVVGLSPESGEQVYEGLAVAMSGESAASLGAAAMIGVQSLMLPGMLVEVTAEAVIPEAAL